MQNYSSVQVDKFESQCARYTECLLLINYDKFHVSMTGSDGVRTGKI